VTDAEAPEGLMLAVANAHDDAFRWRVAAAVVEVATANLGLDENDAFSKKAVYEWTTVGEVFARHLAIGRKMAPTATDEEVVQAVRQSWASLQE
jgi:hypothetical protein